jgi:hypothetical protein
MEKVKVTPTEDNRLYIHPDTKQEFPSGKVVETDHDWFVKAKLNMGHLRVVKEEEQPVELQTGNGESNPPGDDLLSLEAFEKLSAADQVKKLIALGLAADEKDEAISNKEKRVALYEGFLNGAGE